jgi:uncharacterized membrane protein
MFSWTKQCTSKKIIATFVALAFIATIFTCFTTAANGTHAAEKDQICETVMSVVDNVVLQTGVTLLLLMAAAVQLLKIGFRSSFSEIKQKLLQLYYGPPLNSEHCLREYSYLSQLFSSGILHSKLHSIPA